MDRREQLLQEMSLRLEVTHKIQLSNNSFRHQVQQLQELLPHNLCLISNGQNRLVVEVKRD